MTERTTGDGTVGKALDVLDQVAAFQRPVRFGELLEHSPYPKATLYRFLQTLTNQRMLSYDADRQAYSPGVRLLRLAHAAWQQSSIAPIARSHLDTLARQVGETIHLAQLDHGQVLYVDKRTPRNPIEMFSQAGKVGPAYCTGVGKVMLAQLNNAALAQALHLQSFHRFTDSTITDEDGLRREIAEIRTRGYGFDREEHEPGIICVAVPIVTTRGRLLGALSVTSTTHRTTLDALEALVPGIDRTARQISEDAEAWRFPDQNAKIEVDA